MSMYAYINCATIRKLAKLKGKRVGRSFLAHINTRVEEIVGLNMDAIGDRKTIFGRDAERLARVGIVGK
jgi:hypothetical protein